MKLTRSFATSLAALVVGSILPGACSTDGLVGGDCRIGLTNCANLCVNLESDPLNCGHCGNRCPSGVACVHGLCGGGNGGVGNSPSSAGADNQDGNAGNRNSSPVSGTHAGTAGSSSVRDPVAGYRGGLSGSAGNSSSGTAGWGYGAAGNGNAAGSDSAATGNAAGAAGIGGDASGNASGGSGAPTGSADGGVAGDSVGVGNAAAAGDNPGICTIPDNTPANCGACGRLCLPPNRLCSEIDGVYDCVPLCKEPLVECNGQCVNLLESGNNKNCGACGRSCPSAICQGGVCIGTQVGHIVALCMDYSESEPSSQPTTLLGNSVFLPRYNPVKILAYDEFADPIVSANVDTTIGWTATDIGRGYQITRINQAELVNQQLKKPDYDVFLVYDQPFAPSGTLADYAADWAKTLEGFSYVGGVIVVLDGGLGTKQMASLLSSSGLLQVAEETPSTYQWSYSGQGLQNDAILVGVISPFLAPANSCVFTASTSSDSSTFFIVTDDGTSEAGRRPLGIHRVAFPPVEQ